MEDYFNPGKRRLKTQVLIIGGGVTGTGLARDLALRGVQCLLVEKKDINAGASGGNHGLLHSGARYVASDPDAARECREEGELLKRLVPHCVEDTGGLFVAVQGDDEQYIADFPGMCGRCGIPTQAISLTEVRQLEPVLSEQIVAAYAVQDAGINPFRLSLDNIAQAQEHGSCLLRHTQVLAFDIRESKIKSVQLQNTRTGEKFFVEAELIVNAAGAWAGLVAGLAGISIPVLYSKGSLLITHDRLARRVINRLRPASNADILVPGGTVSILGTTSTRIENPDEAYPTVEEIDLMVEEAGAMIPALETTRYIRAYCGVRPLISLAGDGGRPQSEPRFHPDGSRGTRGGKLYHDQRREADHLSTDGRKNGRSGLSISGNLKTLPDPNRTVTGLPACPMDRTRPGAQNLVERT